MFELIINTLFTKKSRKYFTVVRPKSQCEQESSTISKREKFKQSITRSDTQLSAYFIFNKGLNTLERTFLHD